MSVVNRNGNDQAHKILSAWAKKNDIRPRAFARKIDCSDTHAWHVLRDPKYTIGLPTLAKLLIVYGVDGPAPEMARVMPLN